MACRAADLLHRQLGRLWRAPKRVDGLVDRDAEALFLVFWFFGFLVFCKKYCQCQRHMVVVCYLIISVAA